MKPEGFIRGAIQVAAVTGLFAFVLMPNHPYIHDPQIREYMKWGFVAAGVYAVITLLARRIGQ